MKGWSFPVEPDKTTGYIQMVEDNQAVRQGIGLILLTDRGERKMLPNFGVGLSRFMFENVDTGLIQTMSHSITEAIERWENHIRDLDCEILGQQNNQGVKISISYLTDLSPARELLEQQLGLNDFSSVQGGG